MTKPAVAGQHCDGSSIRASVGSGVDRAPGHGILIVGIKIKISSAPSGKPSEVLAPYNAALVRIRTLTIIVAAATVLVAACSSSPIVAEVNGEMISAADVKALSADTPDDVIIPGAPFRDALGLLIINAALRTAAEEQFGLTGLNDPDRIAARIADPPTEREATVFNNITADPRLTQAFAEGAAENYAIHDAVLAEMVTDEGQDEAALDQIFFDWRQEAIETADINVRSQVGVWGGLADGVLPPP